MKTRAPESLRRRPRYHLEPFSTIGSLGSLKEVLDLRPDPLGDSGPCGGSAPAAHQHMGVTFCVACSRTFHSQSAGHAALQCTSSLRC